MGKKNKNKIKRLKKAEIKKTAHRVWLRILSIALEKELYYLDLYSKGP